MKSVKDLVNDTIEKAKNSQEFTIQRNLPDNFEFMGLIPFDLKIKDGIITATVIAQNQNAADTEFNTWLENCTLGY